MSSPPLSVAELRAARLARFEDAGAAEAAAGRGLAAFDAIDTEVAQTAALVVAPAAAEQRRGGGCGERAPSEGVGLAAFDAGPGEQEAAARRLARRAGGGAWPSDAEAILTPRRVFH